MGGLAGGAPILVGERELDGGSFTVLPEPGRSDSPPLAVGFKVGIAETDSPRFFVGLYDLMVTSSFEPDFGRAAPTRSRGLPGEFSFRIGEPRRVGVGMDEVCLVGDGVVRDGVRGEALDCLFSRSTDSGLRGVCGDHVGTSSASCKVLRSLSEERRFLRGGPDVGGTSPIVPSPPKNGRPVVLEFSNVNAPSTVGRSRDDGRFGESRPVSVEFERPSRAGPALDKLGG